MFGNLILSTTFVISFGLFLVLLLIALGVDFQSIFARTKKTGRVGRHVDSKVVVYELNAALLQSGLLMRDALAFDGKDERKAQIASLRKTKVQRKQYLDLLARGAIADQGRHLMAAIVVTNKDFMGLEDEFIRLIEADQMKAAKPELLLRLHAALFSHIEAVNAFLQFQQAGIKSDNAAV